MIRGNFGCLRMEVFITWNILEWFNLVKYEKNISFIRTSEFNSY